MSANQNSYAAPDFWSKKAFAQGYPARSVFKLEEIEKKFSLLKKCHAVLDLGAAPGSWTAWLLRNLRDFTKIVSVDLKPLAKSVTGENLVFLQGDLLSAEICTKIKALSPFDVVLCDAAPNTTGNKIVDTAASNALAQMAFWYAQNFLKEGGNFCVKIFQNGAQQNLLLNMRKFFQKAKSFKPIACRSQSFETYFVGLNKKIGIL